MNLNLNHCLKITPALNPVYVRYLSAGSFLSFGAYYLYVCINHTDQMTPRSPSTEEEEMRKWSLSLQDPSHKNYNPYINKQKKEVNIWEWNNTPEEFANKK